MLGIWMSLLSLKFLKDKEKLLVYQGSGKMAGWVVWTLPRVK